MENGEIARYEQFLLFLQCFQKTGTALQTHKNQGLFGKGLHGQKVLQKTIGKGEIACYR